MKNRFKFILSLVLVGFLTTTCKEHAKDEKVDLPSSYEVTTAILGCLTNENQQAILVVDFLTEKKGGKKVDVASIGKLLIFNTQDQSDISTDINSIFFTLETDSTQKGKIPSKLFIESLKKNPRYSSTKEVNQQQLVALFKGEEILVINNKAKSSLIIDFFSLFSSNANAQQNDVKKIVSKFIYGLIQITLGCSLYRENIKADILLSIGSVNDLNLPFDCTAGITNILSATKELWNEIVAKSFLDALDLNNDSSLQNIQNSSTPAENSSGNAGSWGDPHFTTLDGSYYDFQGVGEFQVLKSTTDKLELQVRQQKYSNSDMVSVNTAIAFNTGAENVSFYLNPKKVLVNESEFNLTSTEKSLSNGGKLTREGDVFYIKNANNDVLKVSFNFDYLNYVITLNNNRKGKIIGLLGDFDGNKQNDIKIKNGSNVDVTDFKKLYSDFSNSWRIGQSESLFSYESGKNTASYTDKDFPSKIYSISQEAYQSAMKVCTNTGVFREPALSSCIYDVALTGNVNWAQHYLSIQKDFILTGPIAYYPFNNNVNDESGNNNNGKIFGEISFTEDRNRKAKSAISLNGIDQFIRVENSFMLHNIGQEVTLSAWILWKREDEASVLCKASQNDQQLQFFFYRNTNEDTFFHTNGNNIDESKFKVQLNKWYHVVLLIDGKTRRFYVDGNLIGGVHNLPAVKPNYSPLEIGRDFYGDTELHKGSLDDIRIYNRILSNKEIRDLSKADN